MSVFTTSTVNPRSAGEHWMPRLAVNIALNVKKLASNAPAVPHFPDAVFVIFRLYETFPYWELSHLWTSTG